MSKLVYKTLSDSPITPARKRKLARLAARPDAEIDFSDIPHSNRASGKTPSAIRFIGPSSSN